MTLIPDSISATTLATLHKEAEEARIAAKIQEITDKATKAGSIDLDKVMGTEMTEEEFCQYYGEKLDDLAQEIGSHFAYKFFLDYSTYCLMQFHDAGAEEKVKEGDLDSARGWCKDGGILQSIGTMIRKIYMGPQDFICDPGCNPDLGEDDDTTAV